MKVKMKKWKQKQSSNIFDHRLFKIRRDIVETPSGEEKEWIYWDSHDSVMVLAMIADKKLVMIRQYRYLVKDEVIEFPSGSLHEGENVEDAARREFEEETGYIGGKLHLLGSFYETYGQLNRQIHLFFTTDIKKSRQKLDIGEDGYEEISVELIPFEEAVALALDNKIVAMGSALAVLLLQAKIQKGAIRV